MFNWLWRLIDGVSKISAQPKSLGGPEVDNQVGKKVVRNRRAILAKKGDRVAKPAGVRSDDKGEAGGKAPRKTVRSTATKNKAKSKALPKG